MPIGTTAPVPRRRVDANAFGLGNNLFDALFMVGLGASGGLAAAPLAAGGAGLSTTSGSLGSLAGTAGQVGGLIGRGTGKTGWRTSGSIWVRRVALPVASAASAISGVAVSTPWAMRHAWRATRAVWSGVSGPLPTVTCSDKAEGYLGAAGQLGSGVETIADVFGGGVSNLTDAARLASGLGQVGGAVGRVTGNRPLQQVSGLLGMGSRLGGGVQGLLGAAGQAQQRGRQPRRPLSRAPWLIKIG